MSVDLCGISSSSQAIGRDNTVNCADKCVGAVLCQMQKVYFTKSMKVAASPMASCQRQPDQLVMPYRHVTALLLCPSALPRAGSGAAAGICCSSSMPVPECDTILTLADGISERLDL
eukprot:6202647-Pleurochrysis_carterae.AAC.5